MSEQNQEEKFATRQMREKATKDLQKAIEREAFILNLKKNLDNLTKDIFVGQRFISTTDYDGNLYECKQSPYVDYMTKQQSREYEEDKYQVVVKNCRTDLTTQDITKYIGSLYCLNINYPDEIKPTRPFIKVDGEMEDYLENKLSELRVCYIKEEDKQPQLLEKLKSFRRIKNLVDGNDEWREMGDMKYTICSIALEKYKETDLYNITASGYFPEYEEEVSRIWVRKCNPVAEALGRNIDVNKHCINFTKRQMDIGKILSDEYDKLVKVRKVFNMRNPEKCRSKPLHHLKEEHERLKPTLKRIMDLIVSISHITVPAYFCEKYGYLIPFNGDVNIDAYGAETLDKQMYDVKKETEYSVKQTVEMRKEVVAEIIPSALHPDRVEKMIEKYDSIEKVFGDDSTVVQKYVDGKITSGVVNHSVFG